MRDNNLIFDQEHTQWYSFFKTPATAILSGYLGICCVIGLVCKFLIAIFQPLTTDTVVPGLIAMEIWKHQNVFIVQVNILMNYQIRALAVLNVGMNLRLKKLKQLENLLSLIV